MRRKSIAAIAAAIFCIAVVLFSLYHTVGPPRPGQIAAHLLPMRDWGFSTNSKATLFIASGTIPNTRIQAENGRSTRMGFVRIDQWQGTSGRELMPVLIGKRRFMIGFK